jgi:hypothetical protein
MESPFVQAAIQQLLAQIPIFIACLTGFIAGAVYLWRYPAPSVLTMIAAGVYVAVVVGQIITTQYFLQSRVEDGLSNETLRTALSAVQVAGGLLRASSIGLLITAVFIRRK